MARNGIYLARAREQIAQQRAENEREHRRRVDDAYRRVPGLRALDQTLQQQMIALVGLTMRHGSDPTEELRALEPYGAGNSRPLFCLQGATLDRAQNVGQNRHLKVRLSKGSAQFDGIFFSATAEQCGCRTGCRVDAAFYLQVNEFRGNRSVQMQIVDIRPSLCGSAREGESLHLMERCMAGETLLPKEAVRLLPSREQFVRLWRMLERTVPKEGVQTPYLPYIRVLAEELPGAEPFLRAAFCLEIFRERGLVSLARSGDDLTLRLTRGDRKISLEESAYLQTLQRTLHATHSGGDTQ